MPEIRFNDINARDPWKDFQETKLYKESLQSGVEVFEDEENKKFTKQKLFESLIGMFNGTMFGMGMINGNWMSAVEEMGKWYESNIHTYQGGTSGHASGSKKWYMCPLVNNTVADDCSGFVQACLMYYGIQCPSITTATMQQTQFINMMENAGFTHYIGLFDQNNLQPGDIICGSGSSHTEIYAGNGKSWAWGNIHDGQNGHTGMPCYFYKRHYTHCWRKI